MTNLHYSFIDIGQLCRTLYASSGRTCCRLRSFLIIQYTRVHSFVNYWKPFSCVFHGSLIYLQAIHILLLSVTYWHSSSRSLPHKMKAINLSHVHTNLGPLYVTRAQTCCNFLEFHTCTRQAFYAKLKLLRSRQNNVPGEFWA